MLKNIKNKLKFLIKYPIHPQWLLGGTKNGIVSLINQIGENKLVLDIGCFDKWTKQHCPSSCNYVGLDYYETAKHWYGTKPDIYGDALSLPIQPNSIDVVLLIDVLEHISDTDRLLGEIHNILKADGAVIISCPFLYPLHDEPRDFVRYTLHGFEELATRNGFSITSCGTFGSPVITSTLLFNVAMTKVVINWATIKSSTVLFGVFLPFIILVANVSAKLISFFELKDEFMPLSYYLKLRKM
jgi:SAM-dependent methyltransferase